MTTTSSITMVFRTMNLTQIEQQIKGDSALYGGVVVCGKSEAAKKKKRNESKYNTAMKTRSRI